MTLSQRLHSLVHEVMPLLTRVEMSFYHWLTSWWRVHLSLLSLVLHLHVHTRFSSEIKLASFLFFHLFFLGPICCVMFMQECDKVQTGCKVQGLTWNSNIIRTCDWHHKKRDELNLVYFGLALNQNPPNLPKHFPLFNWQMFDGYGMWVFWADCPCFPPHCVFEGSKLF